MHTSSHSLAVALELMQGWIGLAEGQYKATVCLFAQQLPAGEVLDAVQITMAKFPEGGRDALRYFCGVCHWKIRGRRLRLRWN